MRYRYKLTLMILPLLVLPALIVSIIYISNAAQSIQTLQKELMDLKIKNLKEKCSDEQSLLERIGLTNIDFYVKNTQKKMMTAAAGMEIPGGYVFILNSRGDIVFHPHIKKSERAELTGKDFINTIATQKEGELNYRASLDQGKGNKHVAFYTYYEKWDWILIATADEKVIFKAVNEATSLSLWALTVSLFLAILILERIANSISSPIENLKEKSLEIGKGNFEVQVQIKKKDEIGILASTFNMMAQKIKNTLQEKNLLLADLKVNNEELQLQIKDRRNAENELKKTKSYLDNVINSMPSALVGINGKGCITSLNMHAEKLFEMDLDRARGKELQNIVPHCVPEIEAILAATGQGQIFQKEKIKTEEMGRVKYCNITAYPLDQEKSLGAVIRIDDVSEKVMMEEIVIQSEKMMSVGGLAAGMAHEINNPLAGIIQNAQLLKSRLDPETVNNKNAAEECGLTMENLAKYMQKRGIDKMTEHISEAAIRAGVIVRNMLSFARKSSSEAFPCNLDLLLDNTLQLAANDYDLKKKYDFKQIKIIREYAPDLPKVNCERTKIQQVLLNLLKNGAQAMAESQNKKEENKFIIRLLREGMMINIEIEDNGPGMPEHIRRRVFEPFFTSKEEGTGTGLGLSVAYFIIKEDHKGEMFVESEESKGTKFIIKLPLRQN